MSISVAKVTREEIRSDSLVVSQVQDTDRRLLQDAGLSVEIPFDPIFEDYSDFIFSSSIIKETGSDQKLQDRQAEEVESSQLLSGLIIVSAKATSTPFATIRENVVENIKVKDMQSPIVIDIPLSSEVTNVENTHCMYLDETLDQWTSLGEPSLVP